MSDVDVQEQVPQEEVAAEEVAAEGEFRMRVAAW